MSERIILDPAEVATGRTQLDITDWVRVDGVDWGDAEIEAYRASGQYGDTVIDYRLPNRQVVMPLMLKASGGTAFATIRESIQAKAALFQAEGGWLKRVTASGGTFYADVQLAGLRLSGGWMQAHRDADPEAEIRLETSPDFYGDEVTLSDHVETSAAELIFTETGIDGNYPARVRMVVDEDQGQSQLGLMWGFQSRNYSDAATAALAYQAEALGTLDTAAKAGLAGASGGTVVTHGTLSTNWTPVLNLAVGGTSFLTHVGTYRMFARYRTTSGTAVALRGVYDVGDLVYPVENAPWYHPSAGTAFYIADLGELQLAQGAVGAHRWAGQIQAHGEVGNENVSVDKVWFQPVDESAGVLRAPVGTDLSPLTTLSARDEFNQTAGALTGKTAPVGGTWVGAGDGDDLSVETTGKTAQRTATSDTPDTGRWATLDVNLAATVVQVDLKASVVDQAAKLGVTARYAGTTNHVRAYVRAASGADIVIEKRVAGTDSDLAFVELSQAVPGLGKFQGQLQASTWYTMRLLIDAAGRFALWFGLKGSQLPLLILDADPALATGGALASGDVGIYDEQSASGAVTRNYKNLSAWSPALDAVAYANQSLELQTAGMFREDSTGTASGPVSWVEGDLPRLPVSGLEGRTVQGFVKMSRGDFSTVPDAGIDDVSARLYYRPCWLTVPGS